MERKEYRNGTYNSEANQSVADLDMMDKLVWACFDKNKRTAKDYDYEPQIVLYLGHRQICALMSLSGNNPELADEDSFRGFKYYRVAEQSHCSVFCLNPPKAKMEVR